LVCCSLTSNQLRAADVKLSKNDGWEKDADARRFWRRIDDRRWSYIHSFPVDRLPIISPAVPIIIVAAVMPATSVLVTAVMPFPTVMTIIGKGRYHVQTAGHDGQHKPYHKLAHNRSEIPNTWCFHIVTPFLDRFQSPVWLLILLLVGKIPDTWTSGFICIVISDHFILCFPCFPVWNSVSAVFF